MNCENFEGLKKFTHYDKKRIVYRIEQIKSKKNYIKLFKLINSENIKFTNNSNGIFININSLSDESLYKINNFLNLINNTNDMFDVEIANSSVDTDYKPYSIDEFSDYKSYGPKLSNYEKNIIKRNRYMDESDNLNIIYKKYNLPENNINIDINN